MTTAGTPTSNKATALPPTAGAHAVSSLNTLGYAPYTFDQYLSTLQRVERENHQPSKVHKPIIFSVAGSPAEIISAIKLLYQRRPTLAPKTFIEINLSCPNIVGKPPPAYSKTDLLALLVALQSSVASRWTGNPVHLGLKLPPYTHQGQFDDLIAALSEDTQKHGYCPISFITSTNTLGSCLALDDQGQDMVRSANGTGVGGMAGVGLHPLALGNVRTLRRMLDADQALKHIDIIGVGGVSDAAGYRRMRAAGASAVALATALGCEGVGVFERIARELEGKW
jgi:dihydroorotate dehydrogenase (fumarate)